MSQLKKLRSDLDRVGNPMEVDEGFVADIGALIEDAERGSVLNIVLELHASDLALLLLHLSAGEAETLFRWLPPSVAGEALPELDQSFLLRLLKDMPAGQIKELVDTLDSDDAADVLGELPDEIVRQIVPGLEDAAEVQELLKYDEDTAGGIMGTEFISVPPDMSILHLIEDIRKNAADVTNVYAIFVVDNQNILRGILTLKRVLLAPRTSPVSAVMHKEVITVPTDMDQEEVARIMERYDLVSLPVVDDEHRLLGRITIDDIVDVIRDEAEEDLKRMSGMAIDEELSHSVFEIIGGRLPWLLIGMMGTMFSALVIRGFESSLSQAVVLAMFIPVITSMAGNAGVQSAAITVQGLASGNLWSSDMIKRLLKEIRVAMLNGIVLAIILASIVLIMQQVNILALTFSKAILLASTVGLSLAISITLSTSIGATVPLLLDKADIDPALAAGPFITTSNDILGLAVYFWLAAWIYL